MQFKVTITIIRFLKSQYLTFFSGLIAIFQSTVYTHIQKLFVGSVEILDRLVCHPLDTVRPVLVETNGAITYCITEGKQSNTQALHTWICKASFCLVWTVC